MTDDAPVIHVGDGARMALERDTYHEGDEGLYVDCPSCGSPAYLAEIARSGRCTGYRGEDVPDEDAEDVGEFCTAKLSLELVWTEEP